MAKKILNLFVYLVFFVGILTSAWCQESANTQAVTAFQKGDDWIVSVNAKGVSLHDIFEELETKCFHKFIVTGKGLPEAPLYITITRVPFNDALKTLLKAAGVTGHVINIRKKVPDKPVVVDLCIVNSGAGPTADYQPAGGDKPLAQSITTTAAPIAQVEQPKLAPEKIDEFKKKFAWKNPDTQELAGRLIEMMPAAAKAQGLEQLSSILDAKMKRGNLSSVNEETLLQAIQETVPTDMAPGMMQGIQSYLKSQKSKNAPADQ
jgi:hypothetical protein